MIQVPILTYHANGIDGMEYHNNDHIALAADLDLIHQMGFKIISLDQLMDWRLGKAPDSSVENTVVLTCDDGTDFDFYDINHPTYGVQTSFFNILKSHQANTRQQVHMTDFVIVSPAARVILDQVCLVGQGWWNDNWWQEAQDSDLMHIANHSWDHNHGVLDNENVNDDSFHHINNLQQCDRQLRQSQEFMIKHFSHGYKNQYFAYPYGNYSNYLRYEYLPTFGNEIGLHAALTTEPKHVNQSTDIWSLPRYVCNNDWENSEQLQQILTHGFC